MLYNLFKLFVLPLQLYNIAEQRNNVDMSIQLFNLLLLPGLPLLRERAWVRSHHRFHFFPIRHLHLQHILDNMFTYSQRIRRNGE